MIHICVFPDTELYFLHKILRMCVVLKYTHIVLEFWGMLKLDAMKELSWDIAFTKSEIKPIIDEVVDAGVEIIPMFNHWGHAAQSRAIHGRHVVLDQNPRKQMYFRKNGWVWDVKKPMVRELMRNVRNELIELCGDGKYFHMRVICFILFCLHTLHTHILLIFSCKIFFYFSKCFTKISNLRR